MSPKTKRFSIFKDLLTNKNVGVALEKPFFYRWMLQGSYFSVFIKIFLLFGSIWIAGYFITNSENVNTIKNGKVKLVYNSSEPSQADTINVAEGTLGFSFYRTNPLTIDFSIIYFNPEISPQYYYGFYKSLRLTKTNTTEYKTSDTVMVLGRHLLLDYYQNDNKIEVSFNIEGYGFLEDIPNYFYIGGIIISIFLFRVLTDKFIYAFTGNEEIKDISKFRLEKNSGLIRILDFKGKEKENKKNIESKLSILSLKYKDTWKWYVAFSILAFIIVVYISGRNYFFPGNLSGNWNFSPATFSSSYFYNQIKDILIFGVIIPPVLFRLFIIFWSTFKLSYDFNKDGYYIINPVSFDNAGGLSPLGEVTLFMFYMFISFFPHLYSTAYLLNFPTHLQIILPIYLIFTFLLFILPLSSPHSSMKKAKERMLSKISEQYNTLNSLYLERITKSDNSDFDDLYKKMKKIKKLYTERKNMPVWPYDFQILVKFGAVFITNLLMYLSQYFISLLG